MIIYYCIMLAWKHAEKHTKRRGGGKQAGTFDRAQGAPTTRIARGNTTSCTSPPRHLQDQPNNTMTIRATRQQGARQATVLESKSDSATINNHYGKNIPGI